MRVASAVFAAIALTTGLAGAYYWLLSSRVFAVPMSEHLGLREPIDRGLAHEEWIVAVLEASAETGRLNSIAACWTAVATVSAAVSAVIALI